MNKILKVMITVICFIIVILVMLLFVLQNKNNTITNQDKINEVNGEIGGTKKIERVTSRDDFYIVEKCIQKYMTYLQEKDAEKVYGCLDEEYKINKNINQNTIEREMLNWKVGDFTAKKMYVYDDTEAISIYFVQGLLNSKEYYITIKMDYNNETFSVLPNYYIDENLIGQNNEIQIIELEN